MEKSIESIWKDGFLAKDALVAPKLNDLYNQKSKHIIERFKKMFGINIRAIVIAALLVLPFTYFTGMLPMGVGGLLVLVTVAVVNQKWRKGLEEVDQSVNSYEYLKAFESWLAQQISVNKRMAQFYYPVFFVSIIVGFWFLDMGDQTLGEAIVVGVAQNFPETYFIFGAPIFILIGVFIIGAILARFGGKIYQFDVNLMYGRTFKKLDELINDIEELRA